jgi:hypothetical protein
MIRLTLILAIVIVVAMIVLPPDETEGDNDADTALATDGRPASTETTDEALFEDADGRLTLRTVDGEDLQISQVIEPSALTAADAEVDLPPAEASGAVEPVLTEDGEAPPETAEVALEAAPEVAPELPATEGTRLRVTGDRVNFRAGPSTGDAILAALTLGTEVELIERVGDGWAHLRVPETGLSGYMSEDFLEPAN